MASIESPVAQKNGLMTNHQFCQIRLQTLCLEMLKKGLEDDQVLSLHHKILEHHGVVKREMKKIPKELRVLLKTAVVRSDMAQRRLLLENQHLASDILPFQELSPDGWNRYKSCLAATHDSLSSDDKRRTNGEFRKAMSLLELHQLAKASFDSKQQVCDFFKSISSHPQVLEEHSLELSANGSSASWDMIFASFLNHANPCSYKTVALLVEEMCASFGQFFTGAAGIKGNDDRDVGGHGDQGEISCEACSDNSSVSSQRISHRAAGSGLTRSAHCNTSDKDSESEYSHHSEDDEESSDGDIPSTITIHERNSLGGNPPKKRVKSSGSPRRGFTEQEKQALIMGVQQHGVGNWSMIQKSSNGALSSRSTGQIKDLWRTINKTNHAIASSPMFGTPTSRHRRDCYKKKAT